MTIEDYLESSYWVIDLLPRQVPAHSRGQYFRIEEHYRKPPRIDALYRRFTDILLKLNCYEDLSFSTDGDQWETNPLPTQIEAMVRQSLSDLSMLYVMLPAEEMLITLSADDTYMTIYNPKTEALDLLASLVASEGLFIWKPEQ
jgi:hypothetical protein